MRNQISIDTEAIRRQYDERTRQWYFSVVDVVAIISESSDPRNYWKVLKSRLQKSNPQLVTSCNQLKLPSSDGKSYLTDVATSEILLEIIRVVSLPSVSNFRLWFEKIESSSHSQNSFPQIESGVELAELSIDMYKKNGAFIIEAFVAGTTPEDIAIRASYHDITIRGSRKTAGPFLKENALTQELFYGSFSRTIIFPLPIELDQIEATVSHGFLSISVPIVDTNRARIIKIKSI